VPEEVRSPEASYYDVPILKQPVWKWQIASYFYLGGLSAGAYLLGRVAERLGGESHRNTARVASYVAVAALLPCPALLIDDLGDPKRFHHMLRVWKPSSPMNLGTWSIVAYSGMVGFEALRQYVADRNGPLMRWTSHDVVIALHDMAGVPFSLIMAGYTGVLLSCTANPLWCKNPWLGPLFSASAISTGAAAVNLALNLTNSSRGSDDSVSQRVLEHVDSAAHVAELACLGGFRHFAGEKATPLHQGKVGKYYAISVGGVIAAEVLKHLPVSDKYRKPVRVLASVLGLAAGFSLRWAMVLGGHTAASDAHLTRVVTSSQKTDIAL
jgi:formate-dependent nitrite reductase membrane component NrfD